MSGVLTIARYALQEALRRRVVLVVGLLTIGFLGLFLFACQQVFSQMSDLGAGAGSLDGEGFAAVTLLGLAMFAVLFLGAVLAVFLTLSTVRGDAERGLLQPLVVRPVGRPAVLAGRWLAAAGLTATYAAVTYFLCFLIVRVFSGRIPDQVVAPALWLAGAVVIVVTLSLLGSTILGTTANGILVFMAFGTGLIGGLLGAIGDALGSDRLESIADVISYALPFEALYQAGLGALTSDVTGVAGAVIELGPLGASQEAGVGLVLWALVWLAAAGALARWRFERRDL